MKHLALIALLLPFLAACPEALPPRPAPIQTPAAAPAESARQEAAALASGAKDTAKDAKAIPPHQAAIVAAVAGTPAAPKVQPHTDATNTLAAAIEARAVDGERRALSAEASLTLALAGIKDRDAGLVARDKALAETLAKLNEATAALEDRARNRVEWALIGGGLLAWAAAGLLAYGFIQAGAALAVAGGSVVRRAGVIVGLFLAGCACFAAAVYFDRILLIGAVTLAVLAAVAVVAGWLHYRKHLRRKGEEVGDLEEVLWAAGNIAKDEATAGGKDALNLADQAAHTAAERLLSDKQFKKWQEFLATSR